MDLIRPLGEADLEAYASLRRRALEQEPLAFGASPESDVVIQIGAAPDWMLFGAFAPELAGMAGLMRMRHPKMRHKMYLWGMYVAPEFRGRGLAAALLDRCVQHATSMEDIAWVQLAVSEAAPAARRLYARAGFEVWGHEPDALRWGGKTAAEEHMALRLQ
ncbi:MAG TPA: GNAT family N-acetyltransferase [Thermoanaerobaculia bacterium]